MFGSVDELGRAPDVFQVGTVADSLVEAEEVRVLIACLFVNQLFVGDDHNHSDGEISECDALANEVGSGGQMVVDDFEGTREQVAVGLVGLLVVGISTTEHAYAEAYDRTDLAFQVRDPLLDQCNFLRSVSEQTSVGRKSSNCNEKVRTKEQ